MTTTYFEPGMGDINNYANASPSTLFTCVEDCGDGRDHGEVSLREFVNVQAIAIGE